jgi:hypothetical protein
MALVMPVIVMEEVVQVLLTHLVEIMGGLITITKVVVIQEEKHILLKEIILTTTMEVTIPDPVQAVEIISVFNLK